MFSTVTAVATPHDVTLQELHVEIFYPSDAATEAILDEYQLGPDASQRDPRHE